MSYVTHARAQFTPTGRLKLVQLSSVALFDDGGVVSGDDDWVGKRPAGTFPAGRWSSW